MWFVVSIKLSCRVITILKGSVKTDYSHRRGGLLWDQPSECILVQTLGNEAFTSICEISNFSQLHDDSVERTWHILINFGNWQGGRWQVKYIKLCIIYHKYDGCAQCTTALFHSLPISSSSSHNMHTILTDDGKSVGELVRRE